MKEILITEIENIKIGHAQNIDAATGCTVIICEQGAPTGVDVRGGGPASRETELLNPRAASESIHAVLLSGGSAFGLDAACVNAQENQIKEGNIGAGTGATVGKLNGVNGMMKSGLGTYAVQLGELKIGAIVVVNALGDIIDPNSGKILAGLLDDTQTHYLNSEEVLYSTYDKNKKLFTGNTTIGVIITNAKFNKSEMGKIAAMAQNGYARTICPVHTTADGDSIYAMSVGNIDADINVVGTLSSRVMANAIIKAVSTSTPAYNLKSAQSFL